MIHLVVSICILIVTIILIKFSEKFNTPLESPKILKIQKQGTSAIIEWYNNNKNVTNFVLLYVDVDKLRNGVWVKTDIKCTTKRCRLVIKNLQGKKYKLAILSKIDDKLSTINKEDIANFSDENDYDGIAFNNQPSETAFGDNTELELGNNNNNNNNNNKSPSESNNSSSENNKSLSGSKKSPSESKKSPSDSNQDTPSPSPSPLIDCSDGLVKIKNIKNMKELEKAPVKSSCPEMENLSGYVKSPFYHYYWDKIF